MGSLTASLKPAIDAAAAAQTTANTAVTNAATAQTTANGKVSKDCGHDAVGSFCFTYFNVTGTGGYPAGTASPGSGLYSSSTTGNSSVALSGTWRALGFLPNSDGLTLFQRIA